MTLSEMINHFFHLYGRRNRIFLQGLGERINFLNLAICDLQDAIRKEYNSEIKGISLARVVARIFCVTEHFFQLHLIETITRKYPVAHCSYCGNSPCSCQEKRFDAVLEPISEIQLNWTLKEWQEHLNSFYGKKNKEKGIDNLLNRLFREAGELLALQMMLSRGELIPDKIEQEFALELADIFAWTIAVANLLEIDLEAAVLKRFEKGCWKCSQDPCVCGNFNVKPVKWDSQL